MNIDKEDWRRLATYRGLAALLVAFGHMVQIFVYPVSTWQASYSGLLSQSAVMMFFVVSGCSIAASAHRVIGEPRPVLMYALNRMGQILPPFVFAVVLMWLCGVLAPYVFASGSHMFLPHPRVVREGFLFDWGEVMGALAFFNGFFSITPLSNGPLWSLSFEVWLYIVFFCFFLALKRLQWGLMLVSMAVYLILVQYDNSGSSLLFLKYSLVWFSGVLLFFALLRRQALFGENAAWLRSVGALVLCFLVVLAAYFGWRFVATDMVYDITRFNMSFGFAFSVYLLLFRPAMSRAVQAVFRPASRFGYTLYLIHFPLYLLAYGIFQPHMLDSQSVSWLVGLSAMTFSIFLAYFAAKFVERRELFIGRAA